MPEQHLTAQGTAYRNRVSHSMFKIRIFPWQLAIAAAIFITIANNTRLIGSLWGVVDLSSWSGIVLLLFILLLMVHVLNTLFLVFGIGPLLKVLIAVTLITCAMLGYFANEMGIVFDQEMLHSIADTMREKNADEALELASWPLIRHTLLFGILPAMLLLLLPVSNAPPMLELRNRVLAILAGVIILAPMALGNYRYTSFVAVEHRDLRFLVIPVFPLISAIKIARDALHVTPEFHQLGSEAVTHKSGKRTVGVMVVGETARADHFSLNGYPRLTNPNLEKLDGLIYLDATACGTSTAYSVPCMFFLRGHDHYTPETAESESNVLDILSSAGIETIWIDNNSTCKHVCDRIENANLRVHRDGTIQHDGEYDSELIGIVKQYLDRSEADLLIVLHMMGSHGPAYSRRYPEEFATFTPYCHEMSPTDCDVGEVVNAYDNSIVFTDYVLSHLIAELAEHRQEFDSFLFYASDHGESLGENGVYLHGLPASIAPRSQTDVPMILWLSPEYRQAHGLNFTDAGAMTTESLSHDNIPHTLMGLFDVDTSWYRPEADMFNATRTATLGANKTTAGHSD